MEHSALTAHDLGYHVAIAEKGGKAAIHRGFPDRWLGRDEIGWYTRRGFNWGFVLDDLVDVDVDASSRKLYDWRRHRRIHRSVTEWQSRRGVHFLFRLQAGQEEVRSKIKHLGMPVDLLTGHRMALGPDSVVNGFRYAVREKCALVIPEALPMFPVDILQPQREEVRNQTQLVLSIPEGRYGRYADAALRREHHNVANAKEGTRNETLNRAAFSLGGLVAVGVLKRETVEAVLLDAATTAGLAEREIIATVASGLTAGLKRPRTLPQ